MRLLILFIAVLFAPPVVAAQASPQNPSSIGTTAAAAVVACMSDAAADEAARRAAEVADWRKHLEHGLADLGILAGPGHFYGTHFPQHIRLSLTATEERVAAAAARLSASV